MKTFKQFLLEKHSPLLYRYVGITSGSSTLQNLKMPAYDRRSAMNDADKNSGPDGYNYFTSTSRSANSAYYRENVIYEFMYPILFELDGRVISSRYKIQPINFSYLVHSEYEDLGREESSEWKHDSFTDEEEDRIYSKTSHIDLTGAVKACYIHSDERKGLSPWEDDDIRTMWESVINNCKRHRIPLWHVPTIASPLRDRIKKGEKLV